jgi:signal transduction histidine kinase
MSTDHPVAPDRYHLTRNFAVAALIVVTLAAACLAYVNRSSAVSQLQRMADDNNAALTQTFANSLWPQHRAFIGSAHTMPADEIRADPRTGALAAAVTGMMAGTRVLKVKFYDLRGLTVFSTDPGQIGGDYSRNRRFIGAMAGESVAELEFREQFGAIDGPKTDVWILSSYIPVRPAGRGGAIEGVAEIYSDVTDIHAYVRRNERATIAVSGIGFLLVFVILVGIVWHADRQIRRYHHRTLDLAASYARADAASKAKSTFLANISHELRTPLNAILGFSEMIRNAAYGPLGSEKYRESAADIHSSGRHLLHIINDVLDLVNVESGRMAVASAPVDATALVRGVAKLIAERADQARVRIVTEIEPDPLWIESDEAKIRQILVNLTINAITFSPPGGTVTIALREGHELGGIQLIVSDNGIGIRPEDIPKALAPFSQIDDALTRRRDGVGLGLTLSSRFAELLGGTLKLDSRPGKGTRITVVLPDRSATSLATRLIAANG